MNSLRDYLEKNGLRKDFFAKKMGITPATLSSWLYGRTAPKIRLAILVEKETKGAVKVSDWLDALEKKPRRKHAKTVDSDTSK
jgi:transcriptional regulator with XRE-family HTH domain